MQVAGKTPSAPQVGMFARAAPPGSGWTPEPAGRLVIRDTSPTPWAFVGGGTRPVAAGAPPPPQAPGSRSWSDSTPPTSRSAGRPSVSSSLPRTVPDRWSWVLIYSLLHWPGTTSSPACRPAQGPGCSVVREGRSSAGRALGGWSATSRTLVGHSVGPGWSDLGWCSPPAGGLQAVNRPRVCGAGERSSCDVLFCPLTILKVDASVVKRKC